MLPSAVLSIAKYEINLYPSKEYPHAESPFTEACIILLFENLDLIHCVSIYSTPMILISSNLKV